MNNTTTTDYRYASVLADLEQMVWAGRAGSPILDVLASVPLVEVIDADAHASGRSRARSGWAIHTNSGRLVAVPAAPTARGRWTPDPHTPGQDIWAPDPTAPVPPRYCGPIIDGEILAETPPTTPRHQTHHAA